VRIPVSIEFSLAAAIAIVLFYVAGKNNALLNVALLLALAAFCLHPLLTLPWIWAPTAIAMKAWRASLVVAVVILVVSRFGIWVWPTQEPINAPSVPQAPQQALPVTAKEAPEAVAKAAPIGDVSPKQQPPPPTAKVEEDTSQETRVGAHAGVQGKVTRASGLQVTVKRAEEDTSPLRPQVTANNPDDRPPTLRSLFASEFPNALKFTNNSAEIDWGAGGKLVISTQTYYDFPGKSKFVGFYIPSSPRTIEACIVLADGVLRAIEEAEKGVIVSAGYRDEMNTTKELTFTGRVVLYYEDMLTITQKAAVIEAYKSKGFDVNFRGPDYLGDQMIAWHHKHDARP